MAEDSKDVVVIGHQQADEVPAPDFEFMVIATCIDAFSKLKPEAVQRVLAYLQSRYLDVYQGGRVPQEDLRRGPRKN
jgi:hypothetical protein